MIEVRPGRRTDDKRALGTGPLLNLPIGARLVA